MMPCFFHIIFISLLSLLADASAAFRHAAAAFSPFDFGFLDIFI